MAFKSRLKVNVVFWWQLSWSVMARCSSSVIAAVIILVHVVSLYIAVYGNATLTVSVYVLNEAVKTELLLVDFVEKK
jgi:hypothetical protein